MTKKHLIAPVIIYIILIGLLVFTAVVPFADIEISHRYASPENAFGSFLEIWAEPPTLICAAFVMAMAMSYCFRLKKKLSYLLGSLAGAAGIIVAYQTISRTVEYYSEEIAALVYVQIICVVAAIAVYVAFVFWAGKIKTETLAKMSRTMIFVAATLLATLIIVSVMKSAWGRMRFREYIVSATPTFTPWFSPQGHAASDAFKSFPSGHTSNALLLLPMTYLFTAAGYKKAGIICRTVLCVWMPVVMLSRILCGAHYLSDVTAGATVTYTIIVVCALIIYGKRKIKHNN